MCALLPSCLFYLGGQRPTYLFFAELFLSRDVAAASSHALHAAAILGLKFETILSMMAFLVLFWPGRNSWDCNDAISALMTVILRLVSICVWGGGFSPFTFAEQEFSEASVLIEDRGMWDEGLIWLDTRLVYYPDPT